MSDPTETQLKAGYDAILPDLDELTTAYVPEGFLPFVGNAREKIHAGLRNDQRVLDIIKDGLTRAYNAMEGAK